MASVLQANKLITDWLADDPSAEITTIEKSVDDLDEMIRAIRREKEYEKA